MAKQGQQKIGPLIAEMAHYDPDNMQMAAKRLCQLILSGEVNLEEEKTTNCIREAYMKQIESENDTVQSEAIKYLAEIVPKLPGGQIELIYEKILEHITNLGQVEKKRERYGACAAAVIHQAATQFGSKLENLFVKSIRSLLQFREKKPELEIILIGIITEFLKKWPNLAAHLQYDRRGLLLYLLKNAQVKPKLDLIKKSETCLGKLALILDRELIDTALNNPEWGLIPFIRKSNGNSIEQLKQVRNGLLCLSLVIRTHNIELGSWAKDIAELLIKLINQFKSSDDLDTIQVVCDILDAALTGLAFTVKTFSRELRDDLQGSAFSDFFTELLDFNVEGMMGYAGEQMEIEEYGDGEDYYQQAEVDEKCWKVRRSVLYYISFLARYNRHFLQSLSNDEQLITNLGSKMVEQHPMVSEMALQTFEQLIELISIDRSLTNDDQIEEQISLLRVKSSKREIGDQINREITARIKIVLNNSRFNQQLKAEASKIMLRIVQIYNSYLLEKEKETQVLLGFLNEQLKKNNSIECKSNLLLCLRELISESYPFSLYQHVYQHFLEGARQGPAKIQNVCLLGLRKCLKIFPEHLSKDQSLLGPAVKLLKEKVRELDSDKAIKVSTARCLALLFEFYFLPEADLVLFLEVLTNKLKLEVEKIYVVDTFSRLRVKSELGNGIVKAVEGAIRQLSESLGSNNYELNGKAINTIDQLLEVMGNSTSQRLLEQLLQKSRLLLNEGRIPIYFRHVALRKPQLLRPYAQLIVKSTQGEYISTLIREKVIDISHCLKIFRTLDQEKSRRISQALGAIKYEEQAMLKQIDQSLWGRVMVGALGYVGGQKTIAVLYDLLGHFKSEEAKGEVCSAIGNILSRSPKEFLPAFIQRAKMTKDVYTQLVIVKQMLGYSPGTISCLSALIDWLLSQADAKMQVESSYYLTAECIGRLAFLQPEAVRLLLPNAQSTNQNRRFIIASALRFGLQQRPDVQDELLDQYISVVSRLMGDQKVRVREGAVKSMASVAQCYPRGAKQAAHQRAFWSHLIANSRICDALIVVIDYGVCKEVRDEGKNLRLEAFNLLLMLTKKVHLETPLIEELLQAALHRIGEQTSNDIVLKRLGLVKNLCQIEFSPFIRLQNEFITKVSPKDGLLKRYQKAGQEQRTEIYLKGILKELVQLNTLAQQEHIDKLGALITELRNHPVFSPLLDKLNNNK